MSESLQLINSGIIELFTHLFRLVVIFLKEPFTSTSFIFFYIIDVIWSLPWLLFWITVLWVPWSAYKWIMADYQAFRDLGMGGTPSTWWGWWKIHRLRWMGGLPDVLDPPHVDPGLKPYRGQLWDLPQRQGVRPRVRGVAPQRQIDQKTSARTYDKLMTLLEDFAGAHPNTLEVRTSFLEPHTRALFALTTHLTVLNKVTVEFGHEICHPHRNDGSLHTILHPEDVKTVIEAGWGERHPIARATYWPWLWWYHSVKPWFAVQFNWGPPPVRPPVPETLCFIYAPRNADEFAIIGRLLNAAAWWISRADEFNVPDDDAPVAAAEPVVAVEI